MHKLIILLFTILFSFSARAQTEPFGKVDTAEIKLTSCDFEKDANSIVLFDKAVVKYKFSSSIIMERHKRIKILNDNGKDQANIRIEYYGGHHDEGITDVSAETINFNGKSAQYDVIEKKSIYYQVIDKEKRTVVFTFPNVHAGSIIEFKYKWSTPYAYNYPDWFFQSDIPTLYSEFNAEFLNEYKFNFARKTFQPVFIDSVHNIANRNTHVWALKNIKSYKTEAFMDFPEDYLQCLIFKTYHPGSSWNSIGSEIVADEDFGQQLDVKLSNEDEIINKANALKTDDEKIAYLFEKVKNTIRWNKVDEWYTDQGIRKSWDKKTGNSTEINLILYHLLKSAKVNALLMVLSTRDNGKLDSDYPSASKLNKTIIYFPADSAKYRVLDASDAYNAYNTIPYPLAGLDALSIDPEKRKFEIKKIGSAYAKEIIFINGVIYPDGKFDGETQISSSGYYREQHLKQYRELSENKYLSDLHSGYDGFSAKSFKIENTDNDTLPLLQTFNFDYKITEPDGDYIYFNPNFFIKIKANPFLSESRISNIDFGYTGSYALHGSYKIPQGYKVNSLPISLNLVLPDKGIVFKRVVAEEDGIITLYYNIDFKKSVFAKEDYPKIYEFYKKMYEVLNEQIVLKK